MDKLTRIHDVLVDAVLAGATEILRVRSGGEVNARIKSARELVTAADEKSDAAMLAIFKARLPAIDPGISFYLEESGVTGTDSGRQVGADPLDGTNHFACGGTLYAVQAHYVEDGIPLVGVVFQPEVYLPLRESNAATGRLVSAVRGRGAVARRSEFTGTGFLLTNERPVLRSTQPRAEGFVACVPIGTKMSDADRATARRVHDSGIIAVSTGVGGAAANVMMAIFGGHHVYANFGAGEDLDLIPPQVIAIEAGLTVWGTERRAPEWRVRKQPFIVAPDEATAELFLTAAGL